MNNRIRELAEQAGIHFHKGGTLDAGPNGIAKFVLYSDMEKFALLIVEAVLDQVQERAYYTGDRDWSDELDRPWIQLEFGFGELAELKK